MAGLVTLKSALGRIGFAVDAAKAITTTQGIDSLSEFELWSDSKVENLCKVLCCPGGVLAQAGAAAAQPNPGITVSLHAENKLKMMYYFLYYRIRTFCPTTATDIMLQSIRAL